MARKTKAETEQTYHALLDAAIELFTRQGVARTTLNDIARTAQMTRGAVYWHFENKDAVILALWERNGCASHERFVESIQTLCAGPDAAVGVRDVFKQALGELMLDPEAGRVMRIVFNHVEFTDEKTPIQDFLISCEQRILETLELLFATLAAQRSLKVAHPPAFLARGLLAYTRGLLDMQLIPKRSGVDLSRDGGAYVDLFFDSVMVDKI